MATSLNIPLVLQREKILCFISCIQVIIVHVCVGASHHHLPIDNCLTDEVDLWFVDDTSWSGDNFMIDIASKYKLIIESFLSDDPDMAELNRVNFGFATYAENLKVNFNLTHPKTDTQTLAEEFGNALLPYQSRTPNIGNALRFILEEAFTPELGSRPHAQHVVILTAQEAPSVDLELAREMTALLTNQSDIKVILYHSIDHIERLQGVVPIDVAFYVFNTVWMTTSFIPLIRPLCKPCMPGWMPVAGGRGVSCFHLSSRTDRGYDYYDSDLSCNNIASFGYVIITSSLAQIESYDKLKNLEMALLNYSSNYLANETTIKVHIDLYRQETLPKKNFGWRNGRPLTYNNWINFTPSGIREYSCVTWTLTQSDREMSTSVASVQIPEDGLSMVGPAIYQSKTTSFTDSTCLEKVPFLLCEEDFRTTYDNPVIETHVPSYSSVVKAMTDGHYVTVNERANNDQQKHSDMSLILATSDSSHQKLMALSSILPLLKEKDTKISLKTLNTSDLSMESINTIPMFDCQSEYSSEYVSYSRVCDRHQDCITGKDEQICGKYGYKPCVKGEWTCASGHCIPSSAFCDLYPDCKDGSDESGCGGTCKQVRCHNQCIPRSWYRDGEVDCPGGTLDSDSVDEGSRDTLGSCLIMCNRTKCLDRNNILDSNVDCTGPEGQLDLFLKGLNWTHCNIKQGQRTISVGNSWAPLCVYIKDETETLIGCKSLVHLDSSSCANFTCPEGFYKCPNSYCIPLHYVRNQQPDCPYGEDEDFPLVSENSNFQCLSEGDSPPMLLHPSLVCDGHAHCPLRDDEIDCGVMCQEGFVCGGGAVVLVDPDKVGILSDLSFMHENTRYVDISGAFVETHFFRSTKQYRIKRVLWLNMSNSGVQDLNYNMIFGSVTADYNTMKEESFEDDFHENENLRTIMILDLSHNKLESLESTGMFTKPSYNVLSVMENLKHLNVSHNTELVVTKAGLLSVADQLISLDLSFTAVSELTADIMDMFENLRVLSLQNTKLSNVQPVFPETLQVLDLRSIPLDEVPSQPFQGLTQIQQLLASSYTLCCPQIRGSNVPEHACFTTGNIISSCADLIQEPILRILLWTFGSAALLGNILVVVYRTTFDKTVLRRGYGIFVLNLSLSDFLMGVYLLIIAFADMRYRGDYVLHEKSWKEGWLCQIAGFLSTWSCESSAIFIFLITLDRFLAIRYPFGQVRIPPGGFVVSTVFAWVSGLCLAAMPLLPPFQHWTVYSSNGMCLGLPLTTDRQPGWQFSTTVFIGVNFLLFLLIALGQLAIYRTMSSARIDTEDAVSKFQELRRDQDIAVAKQLSLVVVSDFLCWFPIGAMGMMAFAGIDLGSETYAWTAVLVVPINSAINPVLYTVPALKKTFDDILKRFWDRNAVQKEPQDEEDQEKADPKSQYIAHLNALINTLKLATDFFQREKVSKQNIEAVQSKSSLLTKELDNIKHVVLDKHNGQERVE